MKKVTIVFLVLIVLFLVAGGVFYFRASRAEKQGFEGASNTGRIKGDVKIAGDNYIMYWPLADSSIFEKNLRQEGWLREWTDDGGNYADRLAKFCAGKFDIIVLPVTEYVFHGKDCNYPGVVVVALSESSGADSVLAYRDAILGSDTRDPQVNDLNNANLKICVTPQSPSERVIDIGITDFDLDQLKGTNSWMVESNGSSDALKRFQGGECKAAVLWEPDVSRALHMPGVVEVFSSAKFKEYIVDVFVVQRSMVTGDLDKVTSFFRAYYKTQQYYVDNPEEMLDHMEKSYKGMDDPPFKNRDEIRKALDRAVWFDAEDNCFDWFSVDVLGISYDQRREKMAETVSRVTRLMMKSGDLLADPIGGNPYMVTTRIADTSKGEQLDFITLLCREMLQNITTPGASVLVERQFSKVTDEEWEKLSVIGKMTIVPIEFRSGTSEMTDTGRGAIDTEAVFALRNNYPDHRILIKGHTAYSANDRDIRKCGEAAENILLSQMRADETRSYLISAHQFDPNRVRALGVGSCDRLERYPGEGDLSYKSRLSRVEFILVEDS
ncbi:MAG: hypothetical protein A3B96_01565 [Candidatus Spechtbacteria bacterium RIFCSPHIGHO2_02_FULL_43_15b]|nr:MAG: hypothetical protein A3B96_01565 [Candidatus Spechtbacteria bacterium RIFCSPHIGHO2_02_FULL_43_15b]